MKVRTIFERLEEYDRLGFAGHPDASGIRGQGMNRQPYSRLQNFPYDRDDQYGEPQVYDRGSSAAFGLHRPLTPHDDEHFSLSLLDLEQIFNEIGGSPSYPSKGNSSNMGSTIPGMGGDWAVNPPRDWDDAPEITDGPPSDEDEIPMTPFPPPVEPVMGMLPDYRSETDDDLENRLNRIYGREDNEDFVQRQAFANPDYHTLQRDPFSVVNKNFVDRGLYGLLSRESAWDRVTSMSRKKRENY